MPQENIKLAEAAYAALDRRDLDAFLALVHPEIEFRSLIAEADGRSYHGHNGVREWWDSVFQSLGGLRFEERKIEAFRDRGITRMRIVGTIEDTDVAQTLWQAWRVRDGMVVWWDGFRSEDEALEAVGLGGQAP